MSHSFLVISRNDCGKKSQQHTPNSTEAMMIRKKIRAMGVTWASSDLEKMNDNPQKETAKTRKK